MNELMQLLEQIHQLSGVGLDALKKASGGEHKPAEGSPAEERGEPPAEAQREGDQQRRPFPPGQ